MYFKVQKYAFQKVRKIYNSCYFMLKKLTLGKNVSFGRIIFYKGFVFDVSGEKFTIKIGKTTFKEDCSIRIRKNANLSIGEDVFFNRGCSVSCLGTTAIGAHTLFGENVKIYDHNHNFRNKDELIKNQGYSLGSVKIGENCWIGSNTVILKNVVIGDNVVIGANCIIHKSIPENSVVKNDAKLIVQNY